MGRGKEWRKEKNPYIISPLNFAVRAIDRRKRRVFLGDDSSRDIPAFKMRTVLIRYVSVRKMPKNITGPAIIGPGVVGGGYIHSYRVFIIGCYRYDGKEEA